MYRRQEYQEIKKQFIYKVEQEYNLFKYFMLSKLPYEIYDACSIIYFYECIHEYFQYNENINKQFILKTYKQDKIISVLKDIYNSYEYLYFNTWCDIDEIINCYMQDNGINF